MLTKIEIIVAISLISIVATANINLLLNTIFSFKQVISAGQFYLQQETSYEAKDLE